MDVNVEGRTPEETDSLKLWVTRYLASEAYCTDFFDAGKANYNLYKSYIEGSDKVYKHSIFVPYSFAYMEDRVAYFMLSVLASPVTFSLLPRHHSITRELCMELEQVVHWALTEESTEFVLELEEIIKNTCIFNAGYMISYPLTKEILAPSTLEPGQRIPKTVFDRLHLDVPSTLDVYPEPKVKRFSRMRWVLKKSWEDFDVLKGLEGKPGGYKNVDLAKGGFTEDDPVTEMLHGIGLNTDVPYYDKGKNRIELIDCLFDGNVITIGGRKAVIRDTSKEEIRPFSFKFPMLDCRTTGAPGEFFGVDLIESMKPSQLDLNSLRSQRRDNVSLLLNKLFIYDFMAGEVDLNTFFSAPGNVIVTSNRDAIDEFPISDVTSSSYKEEEALLYDIQSITSMWNYSYLTDFEILTDKGWKQFDDITLNDDVMTLNTETGEIEYHKPHNKYVSPELEFEYYKVNTKHMEGEFTKNHRFPAQGRLSSGKLGKIKFVNLNELAPKTGFKVPITGQWNCKDIDYYEIPQLYGKKDILGKERFYSKKEIKMQDWVAFLGIYIAEGWTNYRKGRGYTVGISQTNKDKKAKIRKLLTKLPFKFCSSKDGFRIYDKQLWEELNRLGKADEKYIPYEIKQLPPKKLEILLDWMMLGDGHVDKNGGKRYFTKSKQLADDVQEIAIKLSLNANIKKKRQKNLLFDIFIKKTKFAELNNFEYAGKKIGNAKCIEIQNETFMARVNGKAYWTGNSRGATPRRRETATGIIRLQQAAQARNEWILRKLDAYVLQPLCRRIMVYLKESLSREDYGAIVGIPNRAEEFFRLSSEDIKKFFGIMPMTESIVSVKEIDTNQFLQAFDRLIQMPDVNRPELIKQLLQKLGQKDVKAILPMLSPAGQEGFVGGVREGAMGSPGPPGMGGPDFGSMAKEV